MHVLLPHKMVRSAMANVANGQKLKTATAFSAIINYLLICWSHSISAQ